MLNSVCYKLARCQHTFLHKMLGTSQLIMFNNLDAVLAILVQNSCCCKLVRCQHNRLHCRLVSYQSLQLQLIPLLSKLVCLSKPVKKDTSLLCFVNYYGRKKFYDTDTNLKHKVVASLLIESKTNQSKRKHALNSCCKLVKCNK